MTYTNYAIKTLRQLRKYYEPQTEEYQRLTQLIQLEKYRLKHGTLAYLQVMSQAGAPDYEDLVNQTEADI